MPLKKETKPNLSERHWKVKIYAYLVTMARIMDMNNTILLKSLFSVNQKKNVND